MMVQNTINTYEARKKIHVPSLGGIQIRDGKRKLPILYPGSALLFPGDIIVIGELGKKIRKYRKWKRSDLTIYSSCFTKIGIRIEGDLLKRVSVPNEWWHDKVSKKSIVITSESSAKN